MRQAALFCTCGSNRLFAKSMCARCYKARWHDQKHFGGLRAKAIARDGGCLVCGEPERRRLLGHHRTPGRNALERIATACRRCHCQIHLRRRLCYALSPTLKALWREQHRGQADQLEFPFGRTVRPKQLSLVAPG